MAEKKFGQKREFNREKKKTKDNTYTKKKTYKEPVKKQQQITDEKSEQKKVTSKKTEKSLCPVHGKCGGCQLLDMPYEKQLKKKQNHVSKLLQPYCKTEKIVGMENPFHYRNKVHAVFGHRKDGTVISGTYQQGTHFIVPVDECLIEDKRADAIICDIRGLLKSFKIKTYNEDTGYGLFRHVLVRTGYHSGQVMVVLVLGSPILPSKNNFVKALRKLHPEITTIILNVNDQKTSMVLGEKETVLYGKGYIEDELCGHTFRISSDREALCKSNRACRTDRKRTGDRCILWNRYDRSDCQRQSKRGRQCGTESGCSQRRNCQCKTKRNQKCAILP